MWRTEIGKFRSFFALLLPYSPLTPHFLKNENYWRYHHSTHVYQKSQSYDVWFLKYGVRQTDFCHFRSFSALSTPNRPGKSKFWEIEKNTWRYYHFILMYGSSDMERDWHNFLPFWVIFGPFTPLTIDAEPKFWKIKKTFGYIIILHMCTINDNHIMHGSWHMEREWQNFLSFQTIFCPLTH